MKALLLSGLLLCCLAAFAQNLKTSSALVPLARNLLSNQDNYGREYRFENKQINDFSIDTINQLLKVQLVGVNKEGEPTVWNNQQIAVYDLTNQNLKWSKQFPISQTIHLFKRYIFTSLLNSNSVDVNTGKNRWKIKPILWYIDEATETGLSFDRDHPKRIQGIDISSGHVLWDRPVKMDFGRADVLHLGDSTILLTTIGLHSINLYTGSGWDYSATTSYKFITAGDAAGFALDVLAVLAGSTVVGGKNEHVARNLASNVIQANGKIYFASKDKVVCLTDKGKLFWEHTFPESISSVTSTSSIFIKNGMLYLLNKGYSEINYVQKNFGKPFLAAFSMDKGDQEFYHLLDDQRQVNGYHVSDSSVTVLSRNAISEYSLKDGRMLRKNFINENIGELRYFIGEQVFIQASDSSYHSIVQTDPNKHYVMTDSSNVLVFNNELILTDQIPEDARFIYYLNNSGYRFFGQRNQTKIVNTKNETETVLKAGFESRVIGNTLYDARGDKLIAVNITEILKSVSPPSKKAN